MKTSSSIFHPESTKSSIPKPSRISDPSSLYDLSLTVESDLVSESTLVSTPGTSTELEIKQDTAEGKEFTQRGKQSYGWMELSEGESDAESELGEENDVGILPPKYMARERRIQTPISESPYTGKNASGRAKFVRERVGIYR